MASIRTSSLFFSIGASWLIAVFLVSTVSPAFAEKPTRDKPLVVQKDRREVLIAGYVQARKFNQEPLLSQGHVKNWHAVVWEGGGVKKQDILFVSYADDLSVHEALSALGAVPGNNLSSDTWERRGQRHHPEPNKKTKGTPVQVLISWEGAPRTYSLPELIKDPGGKGIALKFGGQKDLIPVWKSGCIVCLYSCPGGKVSNAAYTANDYLFKATRFTAREDILPPDGTEVIMTLSLNVE